HIGVMVEVAFDFGRQLDGAPQDALSVARPKLFPLVVDHTKADDPQAIAFAGGPDFGPDDCSLQLHGGHSLPGDDVTLAARVQRRATNRLRCNEPVRAVANAVAGRQEVAAGWNPAAIHPLAQRTCISVRSPTERL